MDIVDSFADKKLASEIGLGKFSLVDLTTTSEDEILKHKQLALLEMCLKHINARDFNNVMNNFTNAFIVAHECKLEKKLFDSFLSYVMRAKEKQELKPLFTQLINNISECEVNIMTYAEELEQRGMKQGIKQTQKQMVRELLNSGVDEKIIAKASNLNKKEIEAIKKSMH